MRAPVVRRVFQLTAASWLGIQSSVVMAVGSIAGTVTDAESGQPIQDIQVSAAPSGGDFSVFATTDAAGAYVLDGLDNGDYVLIFEGVGSTEAYVDEVFNDKICPQISCDVGSLFDTVTVADGVTTADADLVLGGTIQGTVTNADTAAPASDAVVEFYNDTGQLVARFFASTGTYPATGLPPGDYFAVASAFGLFAELHEDIPCPNGACAVTTGTPVSIVANGSVTLDFALNQGAVLSGVVTDADTGSPLADIALSIWDPDRFLFYFALTDAGGAYSVAGLPSGNYRVATSTPTLFYIDQAYAQSGNIFCLNGGCIFLGEGDALALAAPDTSPSIDFALELGGGIFGQFTDQGTSNPLSGQALLFNAGGDFVFFQDVAGDGNYGFRGLPEGIYYVDARAFQGYIDEVHGGLPCPGVCDVRGGTPLQIFNQQTLFGRDIALEQGATLSGTLSGNAVGSRGAAAIVEGGITVYDASGGIAGFGTANFAGDWTSTALLPGDYTVRSGTPSNGTFNVGHIEELYDDLPCPGLSCDPTTGQVFNLTGTDEIAGIDLLLDPGFTISGTVIDSATSNPVSGLGVLFYDGDGVLYGSAISDVAGAFESTHMPAGTYYGLTASGDAVPFPFAFIPSSPFVDTLLGGVPCPGGVCDVTQGTPIVIGNRGVPAQVTFEIEQGATIAGSVSSSSGASLAGVTVEVYSSAGDLIVTARSNPQGEYATSGLEAGTYYLRTADTQGYFDVLYDGADCAAGCDPLTGTAVVAGAGENVENVNFGLQSSVLFATSFE